MPDEQYIVVDQIVDAGHALAWCMPVCVYHDNDQSLRLIDCEFIASMQQLVKGKVLTPTY
jgi:hypothetical protein